jgi:hypothetical protein
MNDLCSVHCIFCCKDLSVSSVGKPKRCNKCRSVAYCNVECQRADWRAHKITCQACDVYMLERVSALDASDQWRKLVKWRECFEHLFVLTRLADDSCIYKNMLRYMAMFSKAYRLGIRSTGDPDRVYTSAAIHLLQEVIEIEGKIKLYEAEGGSLCDLAQMYVDDGKKSFACYQQAHDLATIHGIPSVLSRACFGLGRSVKEERRYDDAVVFFRTGVAAGASIVNNPIFELNCIRELIEVLSEMRTFDEAELLTARFAALLDKMAKISLCDTSQMQMLHHVNIAHIYEGRGKLVEAECEVHKMIDLIHANKSKIHDWRAGFVSMLKNANKRLKMLDPYTGDKCLVKMMADLAQMHRIPSV